VLSVVKTISSVVGLTTFERHVPHSRDNSEEVLTIIPVKAPEDLKQAVRATHADKKKGSFQTVVQLYLQSPAHDLFGCFLCSFDLRFVSA